MRHLKQININKILFLDIETVPKWDKFSDVPDNVKKEWIYKFKFKDNAPKDPVKTENPNEKQEFLIKQYDKYFADLWEKKSSFSPEFSKICCISAGYLYGDTLKLKSYSHENESFLLEQFTADLVAFDSFVKGARLCAHYGKGFDFPFIAKRLFIHRMNVPVCLDNYGLKPWETSLIDTWEIWKIGGIGDSATIGSIAMSFGLPSPKDDIGGAEVKQAYYNGEIERIVKYCEKDVLCLVNVFKSMRGEKTIKKIQNTL